jgi:MarR family 2-MHQ and catechol resistance regulon transcriptional repressor
MQVKSGTPDLKALRDRARRRRAARDRATETTDGGAVTTQDGISLAKLERLFPQKRYVSETGKTSRAFRAYVDLMDTADWLREKMSRQLWRWDLSMPQFRVLETLYNEGPQHQQELSRKFRCSKQNVASTLKRLEEDGWIRRESGSLPRTSEATWVNPKAKTARAAKGRRVVNVMLSPDGQRLFPDTFRKHSKVVKAKMRALEGREQHTLSRLCRKLRQGDVLRFVQEFRRCDWDLATDQKWRER